MLARALVGVGLLASQASAEKLKAPTCGSTKAAAKLRTVRDVDWCNYTFGFWKGGTLRDGRGRVHIYQQLGQAHDTINVSLRGVIYGDYNGDKRLDAAVVLEKTTWIADQDRSFGGTTVYIYTLAAGKPQLVGSIGAGTPVEAITLGKGIVTVTSGPPTAKATLRYRRDKDDFVVVADKK